MTELYLKRIKTENLNNIYIYFFFELHMQIVYIILTFRMLLYKKCLFNGLIMQPASFIVQFSLKTKAEIPV